MSIRPNQREFSETRWSIVARAGQDASGTEQALATLCAAYWYPLYAFARRQGLGPHDAEDATQGFFAGLLAHNALARVDRAKGRFRTFLLASFKHFLADEYDKRTAAKRGGGAVPIALDAITAEERYHLEPADQVSPDRLYDRRWALTVIDQALDRLEREYAAGAKQTLFDALKPLLTAPGGVRSYDEIGRDLGISEGAVKIAVHRLRQRYGAALRAEIAETVSSKDEIEAELRHLLSALGS
jgi:RNA polymerase sigma factor (sigma-70 family)